MNAHGLAGADLRKAFCLRGMSEQFIFFPNYEKNREFLLRIRCKGNPAHPPRPGEAPHPPPLPENLPLGLHRKLPSGPPASAQEVSESENRPATRGTAHSEVQGDDRGTARCSDRPMAALHFLLPTGDRRSGRRSFDSKLISLLPLDEVPVQAAKEKPTPI